MTNLLALWAVALAAAHAYAAIWLFKILKLSHPDIFAAFDLRHLLQRFRPVRHSGARRRAEQQPASRGPAPLRQLSIGNPAAASSSIVDIIQPSQSYSESEGDAPDAVPELPDPLVVRKASVMVARMDLEWRNLGCQYKTGRQPPRPKASLPKDAACGGGDAHNPPAHDHSRGRGNTKHVLQGVWGRASPGEMQALVGPSGAGKSTLMDLLAKRKNVGLLSGQLLVNGKPATSSFVKRTAYVPQEDTFAPVMTSEEALMFTASLVLPPGLGRAERLRRVREVLDVLGLLGAAGTMVGGPLPGGLNLRGISGGERKRLAVAAGILSSPSVLLLDEPTSGLDASAALTVMRYLRTMASVAGHVVIASIHQPRAAIWSLFDTVTVLSAGRLLFHGPTDIMVPWFNKALKAKYEPSIHGCACDWVLDLVSVASPSGASGGAATSYSMGAHDNGRLGTSLDVLVKACGQFLHCYQTGTVTSTATEETETETESTGSGASSVTAASPASSVAVVPIPRKVTRMVTFSSSAPQLAHGSNAEESYPGNRPAGPHADSEEIRSSGASLVQDGALQQRPGSRVRWLLPGAHAGRPSAEEGEEQQEIGIQALRKPTPWTKTRAGENPQDWADSGPVAEGKDGSSQGQRPALDTSAGSNGCKAPQHDRQEQQHAGHTLDEALDLQEYSGTAPAEQYSGTVPSECNPRAPAAAPAGPQKLKPRHPFLELEQAGGSAEAAARKLLKGSEGSGYGACIVKSLTRFQTLLWREVVIMTRNPADVAGRTLTFAWVALVVGLVYYQLPAGLPTSSSSPGPGQLHPAAPSGSATEAFTAVQLRLNTMFSNAAFFMLMPYISMSLYTADRRYYLSEVSSKLYGPGSYYLAKTVATLPFNAASATVYCLIVYGMAGLKAEAGAVVLNAALSTLLSLIAVQVLHLAATLAPNQDIAFMMAIAWTALNLLLSNFFITFDQLSLGWLSRLRWLSAMGYSVSGMSNVELKGGVFDCSGGASSSFIALLPEVFPNTTLLRSALVTSQLNSPGQNCIFKADAILQSIGLDRSIGSTLGILLGYLLVVHVFTFAALVWVSKKAERR